VLIEDGSSVGPKMQRVNRHWSARQYGAFAVLFQIPSQFPNHQEQAVAACAHAHVVGANLTPRTPPHVGSPNISVDPLAARRPPPPPSPWNRSRAVCTRGGRRVGVRWAPRPLGGPLRRLEERREQVCRHPTRRACWLPPACSVVCLLSERRPCRHAVMSVTAGSLTVEHPGLVWPACIPASCLPHCCTDPTART